MEEGGKQKTSPTASTGPALRLCLRSCYCVCSTQAQSGALLRSRASDGQSWGLNSGSSERMAGSGNPEASNSVAWITIPAPPLTSWVTLDSLVRLSESRLLVVVNSTLYHCCPSEQQVRSSTQRWHLTHRELCSRQPPGRPQGSYSPGLHALCTASRSKQGRAVQDTVEVSLHGF